MPIDELAGALLPDDVADGCRRQLERYQAEWLLNPSTGQWPLSVALRCPSDKQAAHAPSAMRTWLSAWTAFESNSKARGGSATVTWRTVTWRLLGTVTVPERVLLDAPEAVAVCAGRRRHWETLKDRWRTLCQRHPALHDQRDSARAAITISDWSADDFGRLVDFLAWCEASPGSGIYLRQLPLVGIDTKWVEKRIGAVVPMLQPILGRIGDLHQLLGLRSPPETIRMRVLDPALRQQLGGAEDLQMPVQQWAQVLNVRPKRLLIVENLATGLAVPDMEDAIVAMGLGNNVTALHRIGWAREANCLYWGDIDTWGMHILSRARGAFPGIKSVLMSEAVLETHRHLWTDEASQDMRQADHLTPVEAKLLSDLQNGRWGRCVRLEQERIHWPMAMQAVEGGW